MGEIKFRGKPIEDYGDIKWFYGSAVISYEEKLAYIESDGQGSVPVEWESIGQYTGLKDKNGKEIHEGDVVCVTEWNRKYQVIFEGGMFKLKGSSSFSLATAKGEITCEVIGNTYEDKHLLNN